jgi:hypothetical protein
MISKGFGFVAFFAGVKATSVCGREERMKASPRRLKTETFG